MQPRRGLRVSRIRSSSAGRTKEGAGRADLARPPTVGEGNLIAPVPERRIVACSVWASTGKEIGRVKYLTRHENAEANSVAVESRGGEYVAIHAFNGGASIFLWNDP